MSVHDSTNPVVPSEYGKVQGELVRHGEPDRQVVRAVQADDMDVIDVFERGAGGRNQFAPKTRCRR